MFLAGQIIVKVENVIVVAVLDPAPIEVERLSFRGHFRDDLEVFYNCHGSHINNQVTNLSDIPADTIFSGNSTEPVSFIEAVNSIEPVNSIKPVVSIDVEPAADVDPEDDADPVDSVDVTVYGDIIDKADSTRPTNQTSSTVHIRARNIFMCINLCLVILRIY